MAHPNEEVLRRADVAQEKGDLDTFMDLFTDDVVVHIGGRSKLAGDLKGRDQLVESYTRFMEALGENAEFKTHDLLANDTHGIMLQTFATVVNGERVEINGVGILHFTNGKVSEAWFIDEDPYTADPIYDAGLK